MAREADDDQHQHAWAISRTKRGTIAHARCAARTMTRDTAQGVMKD
jgi:hypothetical protein